MVGGLNEQSAEKTLTEKLDEKLETRELLIAGEDYYKIVTYKELGVKNDYNKAAKEAYKIGRTGNIFYRLKEIYDVSFKGKNIDIEVIKDTEKIKEIVEVVDAEASKEKQDATIRLTNGQFIVSDEIVGRVVNTENLEEKIEASIDNFDSVDITIKLDKPKATKELLSEVKEELGVYTTKFGLRDSNRVFNIQRSSNSIDNMVVLPGDTFSFNSTTGPRSLKAGYKNATVISNGEFVPGEGGGVCQVSSTLYNTLLNSHVNIVERHSHSLPISYVPPGRDATVAFDVLDLKFKNNYSSPVYIKSAVAGNTITIRLYGNKQAKP